MACWVGLPSLACYPELDVGSMSTLANLPWWTRLAVAYIPRCQGTGTVSLNCMESGHNETVCTTQGPQGLLAAHGLLTSSHVTLRSGGAC